MALVLDETFASGIPAGFAVARQFAGTLTVSYDGSSQAVALGNTTAGESLWDITSQPLRAAGEMECDIELAADYSGGNLYRHAGVWAVTGEAAVSNGVRFDHFQRSYAIRSRVGTTAWNSPMVSYVAEMGDALRFEAAGDRRTFSLRWDMTSAPAAGALAYEGRVDGTLILCGMTPFAALRPGVFVYWSRVLVHSVRVWDAPQAPLTAIGTNAFPSAVGRRICAPPEARQPGPPRTTFRGLPLARRDQYFGGAARVVGTVKKTGSPNAPLARRICLIDEASRLLIAETWSDAVTGAYSFDYVRPDLRYTVLAYDYAHDYRAVLADNLQPEPMP